MSDRRRRLHATKSIKDLEPGDYVHRVGSRKVGLVEKVMLDGFVWVVWGDGRRDYLPRGVLRRVRAGGGEFDRRKP